MAKTNQAFDAIGSVRDFSDTHHSKTGKATFFLDVGNMMVPCHINVPAGTPPTNGQHVRIVGKWILDQHRLLCVEVYAVYPEKVPA